MESSDSNNRDKECCEVCRSTIFNANIFEKIVCKQCSRAVHRFCYLPDLRDRKNFKCDECRKDIQARCSICRNGNGILKDVGEKHWVHVMCGLFSPKIKVISYRTLEMKYIPPSEQRDDEVDKPCLLCNHKSAQVFHCWHKDCKLYAHVGCVLGSRFHSGQECFLTYNLLDKHSMMLPFHMQNYDEHFICFRYLRRRKLRPFVCYQHNDDPHFIFCTCGRSKIRKDEQQVKQINCDRCKRWFHLQCTAVKNLNLDYECNGCKQNDFFRKSLFLPQIVERLAEIQSSSRLDRKSLKILDSIIFHFSSNIEDICLQRKNIDEVNRFFLQRTLERMWKEDKYDERSQKYFNYKEKDSVVLEILNYIARKEDRASKNITLKSTKEILDYLRDRGREIGLTSEAFSQCEEFVRARIKYLQRHERQKTGQKDRTAQRDRYSERDKISQKQRHSSRDKQKLLSSSSVMQKAATTFTQKVHETSAKQMPSSEFHHLNQVVSKFTYGIQHKGPFSTEVLARQTKEFIKTIQRSDLAREAFSTLISKNSPILLEVLFKSRLDEEQYNVVFSKFRFLCSLRPKKKITQFQICRLMDWYESTGFHNLHPSKRQQLNTIFREIIKDFKVVPNYEENEKTLHKVIAKLTAGLPPRQICLIRNSLVKKLMFLAAGSQICVSDYTDIYYSIKKQKTLKSVSAPLKQELVTVVEDIKTQLQDPAFSSSLTGAEKKELERFMNRSNFYMKLVLYHTKVKGLGNFAGNVKVDQEIPFEELCVLGGFNNLKEMTFEAMNNWDMTPQSANFAFKLLCQQPLSGVTLSGRQRQIVISFIKNILAAICPSYLDYPGTIYPNLLKPLCSLIAETGQERAYPSFKIMQQQYNEWKKGLQKFNNINQELQNLGSVFDIIDLATKKKAAVQNIRLDLTSQLRKLQIIRIWGQISKKLLTTLPQTKFTLISLHAMKSYIDKCQYPENKLRKIVDSLYEQAKEIGRKLRYFQKGKFKDDELWEQISRISKKPWRFQGEEFLLKLKKVDLDLFFQILDFEEMIEQHSKLPQDLKEWSQQQSTVLALQKMRKTIIENPFRIQNLSDFDHLYRKIYHLKCLEPIENINQRQYNRMLSLGGTAIPTLLEKTINLSIAYNKLELARKQVMQSKPREQILIPYDNKQLQKDLIIDEAQLYSLGTMNLNARRLKEKLRMLKQQRADWQKYIELIAQVTRQPIAMPDIALEIVGMKRVVDQCIDDAKLIVMGQSNQLYCQQSLELLQKYKNSGIKHHEMEHFQTLCKHYRKIFDFQNRVLVDFKLYVEFNRLCEEYMEISKNLNVRKLRQDIFQQISSIYIARPGYPPQIGEVLLREGGYIIQKPLLSTDVVPKLMKITKRLFNIPLKGDIHNPSVSSLQDSEVAQKSVSQVSQGSRQMAAEQYVNPMKMQTEEYRARELLAIEPE